MSEDLTALEMLECAKINFENCIKMGFMAENPIFKIAMKQLEDAIKMIEEMEDEK